MFLKRRIQRVFIHIVINTHNAVTTKAQSQICETVESEHIMNDLKIRFLETQFVEELRRLFEL